MLLSLRFLIASWLLCWSAMIFAQSPPAVSEYAVKSALLYKIPRFVYLPEAVESADQRLCVLGKNPFGNALEKLAFSTPEEVRVKVLNIASLNEAKACHFVFIARSEAADLDFILQRLARHSIVTVSDISGFAKRGGMVEFELKEAGNTSVSIVINRRAAEELGIKFNAQLLRLARLVE